MATMIMKKKKFLDWLDKQLTDDQVILFTQDMTGNLTYSKKRNEKNMSFSFAADAFKKKESVGDIVYGTIPVFAAAVCEQKDTSDSALELFNKEN